MRDRLCPNDGTVNVDGRIPCNMGVNVRLSRQDESVWSKIRAYSPKVDDNKGSNAAFANIYRPGAQSKLLRSCGVGVGVTVSHSTSEGCY